MISAKEAMELPIAQFPREEMVPFRAVMKTIDAHIRKTMNFAGPSELLQISFRDMPPAVCQLAIHVMRRRQWEMRAQLMYAESSLRGGRQEPHHWDLVFAVHGEVYDALPFVQQMTDEADSLVSAGETLQ